MAEQKNVLARLMAEYIALRQTGKGRDQSWLMIRAKAKSERVMDHDITLLLRRARDWEEAQEDPASPAPPPPVPTKPESSSTDAGADSPPTTASPPENTAEKASPSPAPATAEAPATSESSPASAPRPLLKSLDSTNLDPPPSSPPSHFSFLKDDETSRLGTGTLMPQVKGSTQRLNPREETSELQPTYFGQRSTLLIYFPNQDSPLRLKIAPMQEVIIGRSTTSGVMEPDVDLADMGALDLGVSRMHAVLTQRRHSLLISDLGSINFTFVNGSRLHPHEARVLQDGDEVRLGRMELRFHFEHAPAEAPDKTSDTD